MDNACREYLFVVEFFGLTPSTAQDFFDTILGKTLAYLLVSWSCPLSPNALPALSLCHSETH